MVTVPRIHLEYRDRSTSSTRPGFLPLPLLLTSLDRRVIIRCLVLRKRLRVGEDDVVNHKEGDEQPESADACADDDDDALRQYGVISIGSTQQLVSAYLCFILRPGHCHPRLCSRWVPSNESNGVVVSTSSQGVIAHVRVDLVWNDVGPDSSSDTGTDASLHTVGSVDVWQPCGARDSRLGRKQPDNQQ